MAELTNCMDVCQTSFAAASSSSQGVDDVQHPKIVTLPPIDKVDIAVEVCVKPTSRAPIRDIKGQVKRMLEKRNLSYANGSLSITQDDEPFLYEHVQSICICDADEQGCDKVLLFWQVNLKIYVYQLNEEGPGEESDGAEGISSFQEWILPAREFYGLWESLIYATGLKHRLLQYSETALLFADKAVNSHLVSWNRVILLHGPPGTGKTSLCKALAQKLSIRFNDRYNQSQLIEVNAHSLFSKWFSESGKLVTKLFCTIQELVEEDDTLVFVLIDEVESLAAARQTALAGSEPSDSIRVVNALLTQLDKLKSWKNVVVLTTSNITAAVDIAFVDRADIKAYIGLPTLQACYEILRSCLKELQRTGIITSPRYAGIKEVDFMNFTTMINWSDSQQTCVEEVEVSSHLSKSLLAAAQACEGLSGRTLRKLPFLAHASLANKSICDCHKFLQLLVDTAQRELSERVC